MSFRQTSFPSIIEAFGSPGVGKSYIVDQLEQITRRHGVRVQREPYSLARRDKVQRSLQKALLLVSHLPSLSRCVPKLVRLMRQHSWNSRAGAVKALFNWLIVVAALRSPRDSSQPVLFSQGAFQAIWSLAYRARTGTGFPLSDWLDLTLSMLLDRKLTVLLVTAEAGTVAQRLEKRVEGQSVMDRDHTANAQMRAQIIIDNLTKLLEEKASQGNLRLVIYKNEADGCTDEAMQRLVQQLGLGPNPIPLQPASAV